MGRIRQIGRIRPIQGLLAVLACLLALACPLTAVRADALPEQDALHSLVAQLFAAAAGTTEAEEQAARALLTDEACNARNAAQAAYRAQTLPWLKAAFLPLAADDAAGDVQALALAYDALAANAQGQRLLDALAALGGTDMEGALGVMQRLCRDWMAEVDHAALSASNSDYACWLYAPDMQIDYPVVQGSDNARYLSVLFNGEKNASGTLFIDYRNLPNFQDPNTLIYGHHMRNGSMFGRLNDFGTQAFYASHPYMLIMSDAEIAVLELLAGYTTTSSDACYDIALSDAEDMAQLIETAVRKSDFASAVDVREGDRLVTLSTCAYVFENARYVVIGRLNTVWRSEETPADQTGDAPAAETEG